ncbi:proline-rich transmembrane protein 3-like [Betta splendens]|uniref:Proline-rich transmembrane protein 3-like n=1 Tax=Betta splendens TaxID=158456 RepID=A0A9W2XUC3_BETSP|nr:proline-rich transmembrane protein 3-like [Betta splendens]
MGHSSVLFFTLIVSFISRGSLVQATHSLDSDSVRVPQSAGGKANASRDLIPLSGRAEGSGDAVDGRTSHIDTEPAGAGSTAGVTSAASTALPPQRSRGHDQEPDKVNSSVAGRAESSAEEAVMEGSPTADEPREESPPSTVNDDFPSGGERPVRPVQTNASAPLSNQNTSGPGDPCVLGRRPCVVPRTFNGTSLLWDDMSRTLAFAWELHVFGSAGLFLLAAVLASLGMAGACACPRPLCDALTVANGLLVTAGALRGVLLLLDPYGTRQVLSRAALAALHNVPLQLLLWAQVALALVTLRELRLLPFPLKLQRPWVVGGLAVSHCAPLLVADLYASAWTPALPLLLQTLSLCWGLPFCMGILTRSLSHAHPFFRSSAPHWVPSQRTERRAKRVTAVCAFFGVLCCSVHMYSLLWLYGLLGNWRRFGWGWWLSQFWARILELAWGFSLLFLGSWVFWTPSRSHSKGDQWPGRGEVSKRMDGKGLWGRVLAGLRRGPLRKSEKTWEDLMPNTWAKYNLSRAGISNKVMCPYDDHPSIIMAGHTSDPLSSSSSSDPQAALLWQKVGERECVLSLIEFDMRPPSPINLRRSIDYALHRGQLVAGGLFTTPPPSWTHTLEADSADGDGGPALPPAYVGYRWMLDAEPVAASLDRVQTKEPLQPPGALTDYTGSIGSPFFGEELGSVFSALRLQRDWPDEDVTDL